MSQFSPVFVQLKDPADTQSVNQAIDIISKALNNLVLTGQILQPLTSKISNNVLYTVPKFSGLYTVYIPVVFLVASGTAPCTLTLTSGTGNTVQVPIAPNTDTITSGDLLFDVLVGVNGVTAKAWSVDGSNSNGSYIKFADGTMICNMSDFVPYNSWTAYSYPAAFINTIYHGNTSIAGDYGQAGIFNLATNTQFTLYNHCEAGVSISMSTTVIGRWK